MDKIICESGCKLSIMLHLKRLNTQQYTRNINNCTLRQDNARGNKVGLVFFLIWQELVYIIQNITNARIAISFGINVKFHHFQPSSSNTYKGEVFTMACHSGENIAITHTHTHVGRSVSSFLHAVGKDNRQFICITNIQEEVCKHVCQDCKSAISGPDKLAMIKEGLWQRRASTLV